MAVFGSPSRPTCFHAALFRPSFVRGLPLFPVVFPRSRLASSAAGGGDEQNRTVDPLLARQVLSQLSYTPIFTGLLLQGEYAFVHRFVKVPLRGACRVPDFLFPFRLSRDSPLQLYKKKPASLPSFPWGPSKLNNVLSKLSLPRQMKFPSSADLGCCVSLQHTLSIERR